MSSTALLLLPSPGTAGRLGMLSSSTELGRAHRPHGTVELFAVVSRFRWEVNRELERVAVSDKMLKNTSLPEDEDESACDQDVTKGANVVGQIHDVLNSLRGEAVQVVLLILGSFC